MTGAVHTPTEEVLPPGRELNLQDKTRQDGSEKNELQRKCDLSEDIEIQGFQ